MISIITCVWNHCNDVTKPFIKEILGKTAGEEYELIIVNNGSTDDTKKYLNEVKKRFPQIKVIHSKENLGFAGGNNLGFQKAKGDYILFLNNDIRIKDFGWLNYLKQTAEENPKSIIGQEYIDYNSQTTFKHKVIPYIGGWCVFARKDIFNDIQDDGMIFDENFGIAYFEDVELSYRATLKGYSLIGLNIKVLEHLGSKTSDQINISETTKIARRHYTNKLTYLNLQNSGKKRVVFYYEKSFPFIDSDYEGKGVGGSEAAFILLTREFAKQGWVVEVYNNTKVTGVFNGVEYNNLKSFNPGDYCDLFIMFRNPYEYIKSVNAVTKIFWSCDQYTYGYWPRDVYPHVDGIVAISDYHSKYLDASGGPIETPLKVIDLGINDADYRDRLSKIPGKLLYCSVPQRGLTYLKKLFPEIKKQVPEAELYITSDYRLWGLNEPNNAEFIRDFKDMPGVHFLGKIPRKDLVYHQKTSEVMVYPCDYEECFCISALECTAAGAIPITSQIGALLTTVGDAGVTISNRAGTLEYDEIFVKETVELLKNSRKAEKLREHGYERAFKKYTWNEIYKTWSLFISNLETKKTMVTCEHCSKEFKTGYILAKHIAKSHGTEAETEPLEINSPNAVRVMKFKRHVDVNVNGQKYAGTEITVSEQNLDGVMNTIYSHYGSDILEI